MTDTQDASSEPRANRANQSRLQELRLRWASPIPGTRDAYDELRRHVLTRMALELSAEDSPGEPLSRPELQAHLDSILFSDRIILKRHEKLRLQEDIFAELFGADFDDSD